MVVLLVWLGFSIQMLLVAQSQSDLQTVQVSKFGKTAVGTGWFKIVGGALDYPHTEADITGGESDDRRLTTEIYTAYIPLIDPADGRVVALVSITDRSAIASALRTTSAAPLPRDVEGTVDDYGCGPDIASRFKDDNIGVTPSTPVLVREEAPRSVSETIAIVFSLGLIPLLLFTIRPPAIQIPHGPINLD